MKNFKRIISFAMAMIICASYCMVSTSALTAKYYFDDYDSAYGQSNKSFALLSISNYGEEDYETDLEVATQAYNHEFNAGNYNFTVHVYAQAYMLFNNYLITSIEGEYNAGSDERMARIRLFGRNEMDGEHYLLEVESYHRILLIEHTIDEEGEHSETVVYDDSVYIDD